jgi:hypothetical protein
MKKQHLLILIGFMLIPMLIQAHDDTCKGDKNCANIPFKIEQGDCDASKCVIVDPMAVNVACPCETKHGKKCVTAAVRGNPNPLPCDYTAKVFFYYDKDKDSAWAQTTGYSG